MEHRQIRIMPKDTHIRDYSNILNLANPNQEILLLPSQPLSNLSAAENQPLHVYVNNLTVPKEEPLDVDLPNLVQPEKKENKAHPPYKLIRFDNANSNESIIPKNAKILDQNRMVLSNQVINLQENPVAPFNVDYSGSVIYRILRPKDLHLREPPKNKIVKRGRPRKVPIDDPTNDDIVNGIPLKSVRTRSGRITKPPRHMQEDTQLLNENICIPNPQQETVESQKEVQEQVVDKLPSFSPGEHVKRNISAQYRCSTCNKAYLGRSRMAKHLQLNPSHKAPDIDKIRGKNRAWSELLRTVREVPKHLQALALCEEFAGFLHKARVVIPKLLTPATSTAQPTYVVNRAMSAALGIVEGNYSFNESFLQNEFKNGKNFNYDINSDDNLSIGIASEDTNIHTMDQSVIPQNNDQNSLLNLLDTGQVPFDTDVNVEEVDVLVDEAYNTMTGDQLVPPRVNTNNLDIDLDLFCSSYST